MTTRVGSATGSNTATMPAHAVGDLIVAFAFRDGSTTGPTIPSEGWTPLAASSSAVTQAGTTCSAVMVLKIADSTSENTGTFTNATFVGVVVYRAGSGKKVAIGTWGLQAGTAATVTYPAITLVGVPGTSWVGAFAGHRSTNTSLETPPTNMTNVASFVDATDEGAIHDTNTTAASWPSTGVAIGGTASGWVTAVFEIREYTDVLTRYATARDDPSNNALVPLLAHSHGAAAGAVTNNSFNGDAIKFGYLQYVADNFAACHAASSDSSFMGEQNVTANGFSPANFNANITLNGWSAYAPISGLGAKHLYSAGASYLGFTPDVSFDRFQVYFDGYAASPDPTVNVDGGSSLGTIDMSIPDAFAASSVYSVTDTTHQIRIAAPSANVIVGGVIVWRSSVKQLTLLNCSWAGALVTDFNSAATVWSPATAVQLFGNVAATVIHLDKNEELTGVALETFRYNLAVLVLARLYFGDVVLISSVYTVTTSLSEATQKTYHDAVAAWATLMGCAYIDGTAQPGFDHYATANGLGYMNTDGIHLFSAGYQIAYGAPLLALLDAPAPITGTVAVTDGADTSAATGAVRVSGTSAASDGADTGTATGAVRISGTVSANDNDDTSSAAGTVSSGGVTGTVAVTDGADTSSATGAVRVSGTVSVSDGADTSSATGNVSSAAIIGSVAVSDGADTSSATGAVRVSGSVAANDDNDTSSASGAVRVSGTVAVTDGADVSDARQPSLPITGSVAANDDDDVSNATGTVALAPGTYPLAIDGGGTVALQVLAGGGVVIGGSITFTGSVVAGALRGRP